MLPSLSSLDDFRAQLAQASAPDQTALAGAAARNSQLTKPPAALGRLRSWLSGMAVGAAVTSPRLHRHRGSSFLAITA